MTQDNQRNKLIQFALLWTLIFWAGSSYVELGRYMARGTLFSRIIDGRTYVSDFANVYNAAKLARRCLTEKVAIYDIKVQQESFAPLVAPVKPELPFYLQYPPYFFVLMTPLAFLPLKSAWIAWVLTGLAMTIFSIFAIGKTMTRNQKIMATVLSLSSYPAWLSVELGQTSFILLSAVASMLSLLESRPLMSGMASSVALVKLQYYPVLGLLGLAEGRQKFFAGALVGGLLLTVVSAFIVGVDNVLQYPKALLGGETGAVVSGVSAQDMQNVRGQLIAMWQGDSSLTSIVTAILAALSIVVMGAIFFRIYPQLNSHPQNAAKKVLASIAILVALAFSVHAHTQDYLVVIIPGILLWQYYQETGNGRLLALTIIAFPGLSWLFAILGAVFAILRIQPFFVWNIIVIGLAAKELTKTLTTKSE